MSLSASDLGQEGAPSRGSRLVRNMRSHQQQKLGGLILAAERRDALHGFCPLGGGMYGLCVSVALAVEEELLGDARRGPGYAVRPARARAQASACVTARTRGHGTAAKRHAPALHAQASDLGVGTALFPDVDVAGSDGPALLCVEAAGDHGEDAAGDGVEDEEGVAGGAHADVAQGWLLHCGE